MKFNGEVLAANYQGNVSQSEHHNLYNAEGEKRRKRKEKKKEMQTKSGRHGSKCDKLKHNNEANDWCWIQNKTFKISNSARSLVTRDTSCDQLKQITGSLLLF